MTRLIHVTPERREDPIYAIIDEAGYAALVAGDEVRPKTSDGTAIVLRLSDIGYARMIEILTAEVLRARQAEIDKALYAKADAAIGKEP